MYIIRYDQEVITIVDSDGERPCRVDLIVFDGVVDQHLQRHQHDLLLAGLRRQCDVYDEGLAKTDPLQRDVVLNKAQLQCQTHHFAHYAPEPLAYAIDRYVRETGRLYGVLNKRLADREYITGDYSIADIACYPWVLPERQRQDMAHFPHLKRWKDAIAARPAVQRAYALVPKINPNAGKAPTSAAERKILFEQDRTTVR